LFEFETAWLSSPGGREDNEDCCDFRLDGESGLWILCDGLGGHRGGEIASRLAVQSAIESFLSDPRVTAELLTAHLERAHGAVLERQRTEPDLSSMRTTIVMLLASGDAALWVHAGDSRLYWFRGAKLCGQTKDHSVPQRLADAGEIRPEQIRFHEDRSRLLRSLGARQESGATQGSLPGKPETGDAFLLASDGFWEYVTEPEMEQDLASSADAGKWLALMEARLRQRATPESDNYSAIAIRLQGN
jgi:serine/threonine protein phosphatase PrpC